MLVIDGNHMMHRNFHRLKGLRNGGVFGMLRSIRALISDLDTRAVVVWDGPRNPDRMKLFPGYKGHREKKRDPVERLHLMEQLHKTSDLLTILAVPQVKLGEADDTIYKVVRQWVLPSSERFIVVSGDKDFLQLVSDRVWVYNPGKEIMVKPSNFDKTVGVRREQFVEYLALIGDKSDDIPGVPGIGEVRASQLLKSFMAVGDALDDPRWGSVIEEHWDVFEKAKKAIDLSVFQAQKDPDPPAYCRPDMDRFLKEADKLDMDSVLEEHALWEEPFLLNATLWKLHPVRRSSIPTRRNR